MRHEDAIALARRQFEQGTLPIEESSRLRAHLRECHSCRDHYDRLAEAEQALDPDGAPRLAAERLWPQVRAASTRRPRLWLVGGPVAALAAAALALLLVDGGTTHPAYDFEMTPARTALRGTDAGPALRQPVLDRDTRLTVHLQPEQPPADPVEAALYGLHQGRFERLDASMERTSDGEIRMTGLGGELMLETGLWTLVAVIASPGHMPDAAAVRARLPPAGPPVPLELEGDGWTLWARPVLRH